jgi:hypothetical protein
MVKVLLLLLMCCNFIAITKYVTQKDINLNLTAWYLKFLALPTSTTPPVPQYGLS